MKRTVSHDDFMRERLREKRWQRTRKTPFPAFLGATISDDPLPDFRIHALAIRVADGTATPDQAQTLLAEFEVFRCSEGGKVVYSDRPCGSVAKQVPIAKTPELRGNLINCRPMHSRVR